MRADLFMDQLQLIVVLFDWIIMNHNCPQHLHMGTIFVSDASSENIQQLLLSGCLDN